MKRQMRHIYTPAEHKVGSGSVLRNNSISTAVVLTDMSAGLWVGNERKGMVHVHPTNALLTVHQGVIGLLMSTPVEQ